MTGMRRALLASRRMAARMFVMFLVTSARCVGDAVSVRAHAVIVERRLQCSQICIALGHGDGERDSFGGLRFILIAIDRWFGVYVIRCSGWSLGLNILIVRT